MFEQLKCIESCCDNNTDICKKCAC